MRHSRRLLFGPKTTKLELLLTPLSHLPISISDGPVGDAILLLREDLKRLKLERIQPNFYLSTGYGTVEGTTNIAVGFYDAHALIRELHKEYRRWSYSPEEILATLRHEVGHAFCYAYKLYRRKDFRETFHVRGHFFHTYPVTDRYVERANPWSRDYVNPSGDHYAQKHPDDDFAETFCEWFSSRRSWRKKYRRFPGALRKLQYVDELVHSLRRKEPETVNDPAMLDEPISENTMTLAEFLKAKNIRRYRRGATGYVDGDLRRLFHRMPSRTDLQSSYLPADGYLKENRPFLMKRVLAPAKFDPLVLKDLLDKCHHRAKELRLALRKRERETKLIELAAYLAHRCTLYQATGSYFG
ncbi:MAG: hypothetical protein JW929_09340 [Anaerolineales bacterium]|nr:hypothetical protein [Anaerolineales bacterium]